MWRATKRVVTMQNKKSNTCMHTRWVPRARVASLEGDGRE